MKIINPSQIKPFISNNKSPNHLAFPVANLNLSVRSSKCLNKANIKYVSELVQIKKCELLKIRNLGEGSLNEIERKLSYLGLSLGMQVKINSHEKRTVSFVNPLEVEKRMKREALKNKIPYLFIPVNDVCFTVRSTRCLKNLGIQYLGDLVQLKESELSKVKNLGRKSLTEIKDKLGDYGLYLGIRIKGWPTDNIEALSQKYKKRIDKKNRQDGYRFRKSINKSIEYLEDELFYIFCSVINSTRDKSIITRFFGWDGSGVHTLEDVGLEYGLTRERVRQIINKYKRNFNRNKKKLIYQSPILNSVLNCISENIPNSAENIKNELVNRNLTRKSFNLEGLSTVIELLKRPVLFSIVKLKNIRLVVDPKKTHIPKLILQIAKRSIEHWGVSTITDIIEQLKQKHSISVEKYFVGLILSINADLIWLDSSKEWYWFFLVPRNRLLNNIKKILSVCDQIEISELRSGVRRDYRVRGFAPPRNVLLNFCRNLPFCKVDGTVVIPNSNLNWEKVLSGDELIMASVLKEHGPVMSRQDFKKNCFKYDITEPSFNQKTSYSPILAKYTAGVFGLRGSRTKLGVIESLKTRRTSKKVLIDYGWTNDGKIWVGIQLNQTMFEIGVFGIPGAMKEYLQGDFSFNSADGADFGIIRVKNTSSWSVKSFLARRGGEVGDYAIFVFDIGSHKVKGYIGDADLLDDFRSD